MPRGRLQARSAQQETKKRKRQQAPGGVARGLIRWWLWLSMLRRAAKEPDPRPSRLKTACDALATFCGDLLAANPLGACCVVAARDERREGASDPTSARRSHAAPHSDLEGAAQGAVSPSRGVVARALDALSSAPEHALREIVASRRIWRRATRRRAWTPWRTGCCTTGVACTWPIWLRASA